MDSFWLETLIIFLLILANGFFAGSEIAIISARRSRIQQLAEEGHAPARAVSRLQGDPDRFFATVQIGVTVVGSLASAIGGAAAVQVLEPLLRGVAGRAGKPLAIGVVVVAISYCTLILGELVPKGLAVRYAVPFALLVGRLIERLSRLTHPAIRVLTLSSALVLRLFRVRGETRPFFTEEEIKLIIREGKERGVFDQTEQELIHGLFEFTDASVKEVMVPRHQIRAIQVDTPQDQVVAFVLEHGFSRYPVYEKEINEICGTLHHKDLLEAVYTGRPFLLRDHLRPAYFVPEQAKVSTVFRELQQRRLNMAVVVDEFGSVEGLVTLEDLIEQIVGEIHDERERREKPVERLRDGSLLVDASLSVRDLENNYALPFPDSANYETLAGFLLAQLQFLPIGGEVVYHGGYKFTILSMEGKRITRVKVERAGASGRG